LGIGFFGRIADRRRSPLPDESASSFRLFAFAQTKKLRVIRLQQDEQEGAGCVAASLRLGMRQ
jgi:hypothetical protein